MNMQNGTSLVCCIAFLVAVQSGFSQTYKAGDKVQVFTGNTWKEMTVVGQVAGKTNIYELKTAAKDQSGRTKTNIQVSKNNIRLITSINSENPSLMSVVPDNGLYLGKYDLFSGIPTVYLGHLILLKNGKCKLAFSTDEDNYENGSYIFHKDTHTIEWLSGMFKNKNWGGKLINQGSGFRIEFNNTTYADSNSAF